jgi:hypothetical protein
MTLVNWELFYNLAVKNRVYPIVYKNLKNIENLNIDKSVSDAFEKKCRKNVMDALQLTSELVKVIGQLERNGVRAVSFKGPVLGIALYGDVSMRTSKDLDILVDISDVEKAGEILQQEGYENKDNTDKLTGKQKSHYMKVHNHLTYASKAGVSIELHWRYYAVTYNIPFGEIWNSKTEFEVSGRGINVLNTEENLLYLIFHGSKHAWKRLRWLCDVRDLIQNCKPDWNYILVRTERLGIRYMLEQTLLLLDSLFQVVPPREISGGAYKLAAANKLAAMTLPFINSIDELEEKPGHPQYLLYKKYLLLWHKQINKKLWFVGMHFHPGDFEFQTVKIKDRYFFLYYFIRPFAKLYRVINKRV